MKKNYTLLLIAVILIWGLSWPINKIGLEYMSPILFAASRLIVATISMFLVVILTRNFIWPTRQDLPIILTIGLLQMGIFVLLINIGLHLVEAGRSAILVYTTPIWVTPVAIFIFKEEAGFLKWLGLLLGIMGIIVLFGPWGVPWSNDIALLGNGILLIAALCWAIAIICARHMKWRHSPLKIVPWQLLIGTIPVLLLMLFEPSTKVTQWNWSLVGSLLFTGVMASALATWGIIVISKELPSITTSLSLLGVPVTGLIFSAIILKEHLTVINVTAMILIAGGLVCTILDQKFLAKSARTQEITTKKH
jgi:drug/metabolite transporter (DMT)-like permease